VENVLRDCIRPFPLEIYLKNISNDMWNSINGSQDKNLLIVEVRVLKSLRAGQISEPRAGLISKLRKQAYFQNQGSRPSFKTKEAGRISKAKF